MAANSSIEWTDHTFNPWIGCTKVSCGCANCYAETEDNRRGWTEAGWGKGKPRKRTSQSNWRQPLRWDLDAARGLFVQCDSCGRRETRKWDHTLPPGGLACCSTPGCLALPETESNSVRPRVFCASLADWLDDEVPIEWLVNLLERIHATPNLDWLLLTKRPENWQLRIDQALAFALNNGDERNTRHDAFFDWLNFWDNAHINPLNVWLGASVENQQLAGSRIGDLIHIPASIHFLSVEPMLGPIDLTSLRHPAGDRYSAFEHIAFKGIDWVICGGESGPQARPMQSAWARDLRDQCATAGVPFFFKQWGEFLPTTLLIQGRHCFDDGMMMVRVGKKRAGHPLDGIEHHAFPHPCPSVSPGSVVKHSSK